MIFCLSAAITAALAYDEKKEVQPETLINGCLHFATWTATETTQEYFDQLPTSQNYAANATDYLKEFLKQWSQWPTLEKMGKSEQLVGLICSMIHTTESNKPVESADEQRLRQIAMWIAARLPIMREAFVELANR
jgi:hypothetical protein